MRQLISILAWFYRQMLLLYPASFRVIYRAEMEATFRRALEETSGDNPLRVLMPFLREVRDLPRSVVSVYRNQREHRHGTPYSVESLALPAASDPLLARIEKGEAMTALVPWPKVGLAILPGLYIFAVTWGNINWGVWTSVILLGICATVVLTGIRLERTLPVWCYPASGLSICIGWTIMPKISLWFFLFFVLVTLASWSYAFFCLVVERKRISWQSWLLVGLICVSAIVTGVLGQFTDRSGSWPDWWFPTISILETVAMPFTSWLALALMPLALRYGLRAALLVLGVGFWIWQFSLDFNYFLGGTAWANLMMALWTLLLLVVAPLWVLRTRTSQRQLEMCIRRHNQSDV